MEEDGLLDRADERMADSSEHRVKRPDREVVLSAVGERASVRDQVLLCVFGVDADGLRRGRVDAPPPGGDGFGGDECVRPRMLARLVDQERRVEDLERLMAVERRDDLRQRGEVPVQEVTQSPAVVQRPRAGAPGDEELEPRGAERVLNVDEQQARANPVLGDRGDAVLLGPGRGLDETGLVVDAPDIVDALGRMVRRHR
jgi:hypothetical protein